MIRDDRVRVPILWLLLPLIAGLVVSHQWPGLPAAWSLGLALVLAGLAGFSHHRANGHGSMLWAVSVCSAAFLAGMALFALRDVHPERWNNLPERELDASLRIIRLFASSHDSPSNSGIARIQEAPEHLSDLEGQTLVFRLGRRQDPTPLQRGRLLACRGLVTALPRNPQEGFGQYLRDSGVFFELRRVEILDVLAEPGWFRRLTAATAVRLESSLRRGLPDDNPLIGVYVAMLLGRKAELSAAQKDLFLQSGTLHLFAISGLHIGVIAITLYSLLAVVRIDRQIGAAIGLTLLLVFVDATGSSPSAVRASAMAAFLWAARVLHRPGNPASALSLSALVILLINPYQLFSASFQLSYGVVLSLLLFGLPLGRWLTALWNPLLYRPRDAQTWFLLKTVEYGRWVLSGFAISLAATLISTPITIANFGLWSPGAVIGNVILVPTASLAIIAGCGSMLAGLVGLAPLSVLFNHAALVVLRLMEELIQLGLLIPGMFWETALRAPWLGPFMLIVLAAMILIGYSIGWRRMPGGFLGPFAALTVFLIFGVTFQPASPKSASMKSAYELAMERLDASDGEPSKALTDEQKDRLAEIDNLYKSKIAEREIFLKSTLAQAQMAQKWEEAELIEKQIQSERTRLEEERDDKKEKVRKENA